MDLVRTLLANQHPDLQAERLVVHAEGWDNVVVRVGPELLARLPRRRAAVELLRNERRWLPVLAERLDVRVPVPIRVGKPGAGFPWPWLLSPWIPGRAADESSLRHDQGNRLARILRSLHRPAPEDAPANPFRGVPLRARDGTELERRLAALDDGVLDGTLQLPRGAPRVLRELWAEGLHCPKCEGPVWIHGDLHPRNVLVRRGRITGIIDWGDLTAGDPATDLAAAWMVLPTPGERRRFWRAYQSGGAPSEGLMKRARAWAVLFGATLARTGDLRHEAVGARTIRRVLEDGSFPSAPSGKRPRPHLHEKGEDGE